MSHLPHLLYCLPRLSRCCIPALVLVSSFPWSVSADDVPPTEAEIKQLMQSKPPSLESWPEWRDYYIRLHFAYDVAIPNAFYDQLQAFMGGVAQDNSGKLPSEMAQDPVAHCILASYVHEQEPEHPRKALDLARQALALGDPEGMATLRVALALIFVAGRQHQRGQLTPEGELLLTEASTLLDKLVVAEPQIRISTLRGMIAWQRNDPSALELLKQGAEEYPMQSSYAFNFLMYWVSSLEATGPFAETTASFLLKFPDDAHLNACHAMALFRDGRMAEAYECWQEARKLDERIEKYLGPQVVAMLNEGQFATPDVMAGIELLKTQQFHAACPKFRAAIAQNPNNNLAAKLLGRALVNSAFSTRSRGDSPEMRKLVAEGLQLTQQFPQDADIHFAYALLLNHAGRKVAAAEALDKAEQLGVKHEPVPGFDYVREIRDGAQAEQVQRTAGFTLLGVVAVFAAWLLFMFALGTALAMFTPRTPHPVMLANASVNSGEIWLERFYLLVLSLSLMFFYLSVPFVALGLLAITLLMLGIMLVVRFIHFGLLYRGLYAVWGVIRCAFLGPSHEVLGMEANEQEHPRLFATLQEVAQRLETGPVDKAYLTPDSQLSVHEAGSGPFGLFGRRRVISIGISTLSLLDKTEFKAVLAHEYGHFSHQDTLYARFISQVTASLANSLAVMNAAGGVVNYINPFYWFYWLYLRAYALLAAGFSRSREFLADRRAAVAYGKEAFISGLTKVSAEGAMFAGFSIQNIRTELGHGRAFLNVFDMIRQVRDQPEMVEPTRRLLEEMHSAKPNWFDSHPTLSERIDAVSCLPNSRESLDTSPAAELLENLPALEEQLTELLTEFVRQNYDVIHIPDGISLSRMNVGSMHLLW